MNRHVALPLMATGVGLLALAASVLPFEADVIGLAGRGLAGRLAALAPLAATALALALAALAGAWWRPRHPLTLVLVALALGTATGALTLIAIPELVATAPAKLALGGTADPPG